MTETDTTDHPALANLYSSQPTPGAAALDLHDLEAGTAVTWREDKGWGAGATTRSGTIAKVTDKSYLVESYTMGSARIDRAEPGKRGLRAIRTPAEHAALIQANKAANAARQVEHDSRAAEQQRAFAESAARNIALNQLAEAHPDEFNALYVAALAQTDTSLQ